ncbi:DUF6377 domain-containing protein [Bacteroides sp. 519]|uniref:DUF6377 domain-containing protein n=1 Tax=Bacteroides sp. 519 TaxID=2302937 RepID=UPI0013D2D4E5|nr:DUF6377 domain-containing protein [Bacteroides sp. 519]NDV60366.1 hypothetical protein [Bacteroides sp. 519]
MKHLNLICCSLLIILLLISCSQPVKYNKRLSDVLLELDETILHRETYEHDKEQRINGIRELFKGNTSPEYQYNICNKLFSEYFDYNLDSAMVYAKTKLHLAENTPDKYYKSIMDLANVCAMAGMLHEDHQLLQSIPVNSLSKDLLMDYYDCYHILYKHMGYVCNDKEQLVQYNELKESYRYKVLELLEGDELRKLLIEASFMRNQRNYEGVAKSLLVPYEQWELTIRDKGTLSFLIARAYEDMGDIENAMYYFASGAICDIKIPVNEHEALYQLASILFERGDLERAYRYINCSMEGVLQVNSRKNIYNINQLLPLISQSYNSQIQQQKNKLIFLVTGAGVLLALLIIAVIAVYKSLKKISLARKKQKQTNDELKKVNSKLSKANSTLIEANNIKEAYIGRYLDLCSNYMSGVEQYRVHLNNILRKDGSAEVVKVLKSATYMKDELDEFYQNFDVTFLHLFPDFVDQFNELLQDDKRITLKPGELLTTELRVFALIRLGITDSVKIAEFLRRSTSTIYNYRVKMRNAALNSRQDFERQVISIGNLEYEP